MRNAMSGTVGVIVLARLRDDAKARAFAHLAFGRLALRATPGLCFAKVLGSGRDAGFLAYPPSLTHQALFLSFDGDENANAFLAGRGLLISSIRRHAAELFTAKLHAYASKGSWSGAVPVSVTRPRPDGPIASLTRGSIKLAALREFWSHAAPAQSALRSAKGCLLSAGVGEIPLVRQATFTLWEDEAAMDRFARSGAHLDGIRAAHAQRHFSESMFARFVPSAMAGSWAGRSFGPSS